MTLAQRLIEALRSGEYEQTCGFLKVQDCFCVMGLACHLYNGGEWHHDNYMFDGQPYYTNPPHAIAEALGLARSQVRLLMSKNDTGETFPELADRLEAMLR